MIFLKDNIVNSTNIVMIIELLCLVLYICIFHRQVFMYVLAFTTDNSFPLHFFFLKDRTRSIILTNILISTIKIYMIFYY